MRAFLVVAALAAALSGCQTVEESRSSADYACQSSGFRPGTRAYRNCVNANYRQNRRNSDAVGQAVVVGAAAGLVGAAIIEGDRMDRYPGNGDYYDPDYGYGRTYYRRGNGYSRGCERWPC